MTKFVSDEARAVGVPSSRIGRFARFGFATSTIAGRMALNAAVELGHGRRPEFRNLLITPANVQRLTSELAHMRGAAMKLGQLLSMDAGDILPPEMTGILARLRENAHHMPPKQLRQVLNTGWGENWRQKLKRFDVRPMAAASIGQVHRATLLDGRDVAIKVQYPGVARSIDSDVANVGALVRMSGFLPKGFEITPYLEEARAQLHEETDYLKEGEYLHAFHDLLADDPAFVVPQYCKDWSTREILMMSYVEGSPCENAIDLGQKTRNEIAVALINLFLREMFTFHMVQSDPNFANYRYNQDTGRVVLLDFGATRRIDPTIAAQYRSLIAAGVTRDKIALRQAVQELGFISAQDAPARRAKILGMIELVFASVAETELFDCADMTLSRRLQAEGIALTEDGYVPPDLPMDALYIQRKIGGLFLLANRLGAQLPLQDMLERFLGLRGNGPWPSQIKSTGLQLER